MTQSIFQYVAEVPDDSSVVGPGRRTSIYHTTKEPVRRGDRADDDSPTTPDRNGIGYSVHRVLLSKHQGPPSGASTAYSTLGWRQCQKLTPGR